MAEKENFTSLDKLGEFGLIDHLTKKTELKHSSSLTGIGDDAAVLESDGRLTVVSSDILVEGVHFDFTYVPPKHLGYKAVAVNVSDICAMNAEPQQILVNLAVSSRFGVEFLEQLYEGIHLACKEYNVDLVGGDTSSSYSGMMISVTAIGNAEESELVYRSGAKPNDLLVVTGDLGAAFMGLQLLEREKSVYLQDKNMQPDLSGHPYALERQLKPEARLDVRGILKALEVKPTSMIDVSDGLSSEIIHLCRNSGTGANLFEEKIPIDPTVYHLCEEFNLNTTTVALSGGEDYELLFTIDINDHDKIKGNPNFTVIGHMTDKASGMNLVTRAGQAVPLTAQGWDALLNNEKA